MSRIIVIFAVVGGALLAMWALWPAADPPDVAGATRPRPVDDSSLPAPVPHPSAPLADPPARADDDARESAESQPLRTEASILSAITRQAVPDVEVPPWADEMEGAILAYIAQQPGLQLTDLQVQCSVSECVIYMGGLKSSVYQIPFDEFATRHGFPYAVIYAMDGGPNRLVYLRR